MTARSSHVVAVMALVAACGGPAPVAGNPAADAPGPAPRGTHNPLVGTPVDLSALRWLTPDERPPGGNGRLMLLRWWTVQCPFCRDSLPELTELHRRFAGQGLELVGVFHRKGPVNPSDDELRDYVAGLGAAATLARDDEWRALRPILTRGGLEQATSISLLVDRDGVVRWVHAGPRLHRSAQAEFAAADADWRELAALLARELGEAPR